MIAVVDVDYSSAAGTEQASNLPQNVRVRPVVEVAEAMPEIENAIEGPIERAQPSHVAYLELRSRTAGVRGSNGVRVLINPEDGVAAISEKGRVATGATTDIEE